MYISNKQETCRAPKKIDPTAWATCDPNWLNKIRQTLTICSYIRSRPSTPSWAQSRKFKAAHFQQPLASCPSVLRLPTKIRSFRPPHRWLCRLPHDQRIICPPQHHIMDGPENLRKILRNADKSDHIRWPRVGKEWIQIQEKILWFVQCNLDSAKIHILLPMTLRPMT